ncbi:hypothetical protein NQ315_007814 [Exocentrus adspersus]|uniref:Lipase n=1 Tax=Exocentrus adspersus TaxID=1586481 RepID=A0AAV8W8E8_9CUCU|nr:hypothetical protein NQ315_007814 [Exocentrus adspersus]
MLLRLVLFLVIVVVVVNEAANYTHCNIIEKIIKPPTECIYNPDEYLDVQQIIARHGYPSETHAITTKDGYVLKIHRIPGPKSGKRGGQPVFLQHGLFESSADWLINGNNSLGFLLADEGYDVWLGNARGNTYSRAHVSIPMDKPKFWNFSWHEMGTHDLPAVLYYVGNITQKPEQIIYIGHSMGTTMFFVFSSMYPVAAKNVKLMIALAPVAMMTHIQSPIRFLAPFSSNYQWLAKYLGLYEFLPDSKLIKFFTHGCDLLDVNREVCESLISVVCGYDKEQFNEKALPLLLKKDPAGTSTKTVMHYAQEISKGDFQQFDYGTSGNMAAYGTVAPPKYNISAIETPIYLMYGENDWLASYVDVQQLAEKITSLVGLYRIKLKSFNHVDFLFGKDAEKLVYRPLMRVMRKFPEHYS